ncbi:MAG: TPM domain-containing protein [Candidatus Cloacimonetes bacterium]|nr:TPM domain-containing protein [Candidatus Cloacimonadota bacterium]
MKAILSRKKIIFTLIFVLAFAGFLTAEVKYPAPKNYVSDYANVLSQSTLNQTNRIALEFKQKTDFEIAVAIVRDMQGLDSYRYANELYAEWGIGSKNDEGVLLLIAQQERKMKIEVGYGAEGFLPDGLTGEIADKYIVPFLKDDNYDQAVLNGVGALVSVATRHYNVNITGTPKIKEAETSTIGKIFRVLISLFVISLFLGGRIGLFPFLLLGGLGGRGSSWSGGGSGFGGFGGFGGGLSGGGGVGRSF